MVLTNGDSLMIEGAILRQQHILFNISGEKRNFYLNKLTHFDLRPKKFLVSTMAQTLIAGIDCSIYNFNDNYIITCNKSFEGYFKERLLDAINL